MNYIIFKIGFSNNYSGIEDKNINIYERFYQEKKSNNPEIYNFQYYNSYCYGYASLKSGVVNLSNIQFSNDSSILLKDTLVVWVYNNSGKNYVVGWYKNATVYNFLQRNLSYPSIGRDLYYNVKALAKDCYLIKTENRKFELDISFESDKNFYIGTDDDIIYEKILSYINSYEVNSVEKVFNKNIEETLIEAPPNPKLLYKRATIFLYNEANYLEAIKYFNTVLLYSDMLSEKELIDVYYLKAVCLQYLNCFDKAIMYYKKVLINIGYDLNILKSMIYLYIYTKNYDKAIYQCDKILNKEKRTDENSIILDEIKCIKAECYLFTEKKDLAVELLNNISKTTLSDKLSSHCKELIKHI